MSKNEIESANNEWCKSALEYLNNKVDYYIIIRERERCAKLVFMLALLASISYTYIALYLTDFCVSFFIGAAIILVSFVLIFLNIALDFYYAYKLKKYEKEHQCIEQDLSKLK